MRCHHPAMRHCGHAVVAVALGVVATLVAACGGGGGAHTSSSSKVTSSALAYANCMRSHGVPDFPDPNSQGAFQIRPLKVENGHTTPIEDLIPGAPALGAAEHVCGPFGSAGRQVTAAQEERAFHEAMRAAVCMRANDVPNYPDPKLVGGSIDQEYNGQFNPDSPAFQRAAAKCGKPGVVLSGTLGPG
jgi:hypothetical protein